MGPTCITLTSLMDCLLFKLMRVFLILLLSCSAVFGQLGNPGFLATLKGSSTAPIVPTDIANLYAWYKGDAGITNTSGSGSPANDDPVAWWGDSSGNGRHLRTNNVHGSTPLFKSSSSTGKSFGGLQFAGTTNSLRIGFTALPDTTIFVVWRTASAGSYKLFLDSTNAAARQVMYKRNTDLFTIASATEQTVSGAIPNPSWNVFCAQFNSAGNDSIYTNGVVASTALVAGTQSLDGLTVGSANDGTSPLGSGEYLVEVIIYSRLLNSTEIGGVNSYLNTRWAVY